MKRILIINPFGIGDVLFTTPMIEAISLHMPSPYIGYVCNIRTAPLLLSNPDINKVFIYEKDEYRNLWKVSKIKCIVGFHKFFKDVRAQKFDVAFDLSLAQEYGLFSWLAGIKRRLGYNYRNRGIFLTEKIPLSGGYHDKHIVDYYIQLIRFAGIAPPERPLLKVYIPDEDKQKAHDILIANGIGEDEEFISIAPGAGASWGATSFRKQWAKENFTKVAKAIYDEFHLKVVLLGGKDDMAICDYIKSSEKRCINLCSDTSLLTFAAIVEKARMLITNDGGPLHIAVALNTQTVSLFGPVDDKAYGPYPPQKRHIVIKNDELSCRPCYKSFKIPKCLHRNCLEGISAGVVIEAVRKLLLQGAIGI